MPKLYQLPRGTKGTVIALSASGIMRRRLMDLGFVEGTKVTVIRRSPLGDPTAYQVRGAVIALRKEEAAKIQVRILSTG